LKEKKQTQDVHRTQNEKLEMFLTQFSTCLAIVCRKCGRVEESGNIWGKIECVERHLISLLVILARQLGYASVAPLDGAIVSARSTFPINLSFYFIYGYLTIS